MNNKQMTADEILDDLCELEGGTVGKMPIVADHCTHCPGNDSDCEKFTTINECRNCGTVGSLFISWQPLPFFVRECRACGDCC